MRSALNQHRDTRYKLHKILICQNMEQTTKALPDDLLNLTRTKAKEQITTTLLKSYLSP